MKFLAPGNQSFVSLFSKDLQIVSIKIFIFSLSLLQIVDKFFCSESLHSLRLIKLYTIQYNPVLTAYYILNIKFLELCWVLKRQKYILHCSYTVKNKRINVFFFLSLETVICRYCNKFQKFTRPGAVTVVQKKKPKKKISICISWWPNKVRHWNFNCFRFPPKGHQLSVKNVLKKLLEH